MKHHLTVTANRVADAYPAGVGASKAGQAGILELILVARWNCKMQGLWTNGVTVPNASLTVITVIKGCA